MKKSACIRFSISLLLLFSLFAPITTLAAAGDDGKKHFRQGMKFEDSQEWDKAVEEFALAITENPKNPEYRLHYQRSIFNASQMYIKRGTALASDKDYAGAYLAFRQAYAYDSTNELAKSEMERMMRLQRGVENGDKPDEKNNGSGAAVKLVSTGFQKQNLPTDTQIPQRLEKLRDLPFPGGVDLQFLIKDLAKDLDLNVLFDSQASVFRQPRKISIELKNVSAAKALDYIFLQEGLFFQKVGPRTILVSEQARRSNFQQLVLRTFYLANADPADVQKVVQTAIPAQPGRTPTITLVDKSTNSLTVRDTEENVRLIGKLINSLDKDRAEVVMDVQIYEVSKDDLLQLGNQIGNATSLGSLGGSTSGVIGVGGSDLYGRSTGIAGTAATVASSIPRAFGVGLVIPAINLVALQSKSNTKLIASTQIHAFNNEDSSARIGRRVPVQTAQLLGYGNTAPGQTQGGFINNQAASVINYEQVGLTLKFKPLVFPNQDVQVAMEIESKDIAGAATLTPIFTERTIKGTARVQNNKTLLLASVAQGSESNGREGLPLLGLLPFVGRLFTAPKKNNSQVDIVIAVTPRVIRAPAILPEDEEVRPSGSLASPTNASLEAMIIQEDAEEQLAAARKVPNVAQVQLPDQQPEAPTYVKTDAAQTNASTSGNNANQTATLTQNSENVSTANVENPIAGAMNLRPIDSSVKTLQIAATSDSSVNKPEMRETTLKAAENAAPTNAPTAELQFAQALPEMKAGEKTKIAVMVKSATPFRSATLGLQFNPKNIAVRNVYFGDVFGAGLVQKQATPYINQSGKTFVLLASPTDVSENNSGVLAYIEIEALADGKPEISFDKDVLNMLTADGKNFAVKF